MIHQNFGQLNLWMLISFIILFMIDLYKDNHVRAYVCLSTFSLKKFSSETIDFYRISQSFTFKEKSGLWSNTGAEAPLVLLVCSKGLLKTQWEKKKLPIMSIFLFSHSVFYRFGQLSAIFIKFNIIICKVIEFEIV